MTSTIEEEGKTVEEAIERALEKLNLPRKRVEVEVLEEGNKGLFGLIGSREARVRVVEKRDLSREAYNFISRIVDQMNLGIEVELLEEETDDEQLSFNLTGPNLGILIGRRGQTLDALQYLTTVVVNNKNNDYVRIHLDAEGYRQRRRKTLKGLARRLARKAREKGRKVSLEPMPPHERRIIHLTLREEQDIKTYSEGQDPYRKVVITTIE